MIPDINKIEIHKTNVFLLAPAWIKNRKQKKEKQGKNKNKQNRLERVLNVNSIICVASTSTNQPTNQPSIKRSPITERAIDKQAIP